MSFRVASLLLVLAAVIPRAQASTPLGPPAGELDVIQRSVPNSYGQATNVVVARIDPTSVGEDFGGVAGFSFALRSFEGHTILTVGLPEGGEGSVDRDPTTGWYEIAVDYDAPLPLVDGAVELAEVTTWALEDSSPVWNPTIQVLPPTGSALPGWATWRESARAGACSETDPDARPCLRPFDRIERPHWYASDRLVVFVPHVVVTPGERFRLPILGRCLSDLLWLWDFDLASIDVGLSWEGDALDLVGGTFSRRAPGFDAPRSFRVRRTYDPPRPVDNSTDRTSLYELEFEVRAGATGSTLRIDPSSARLQS